MICDAGEIAKIKTGGERWTYLTSRLILGNVAITNEIFNKTGVKASIEARNLLSNQSIAGGVMKEAASLFLLIGMFVISTSSFAFTDICEMGGKALTMTTAQMKEFHEHDIKGRRIEGSGKVYDVKVGSNPRLRTLVSENTCTIIVNCGNDVYIHVDAGDYWGSKKDIKVGQAISFTGICYDLNRRYYRDSDKSHIEAFVEEAFLKY